MTENTANEIRTKWNKLIPFNNNFKYEWPQLSHQKIWATEWIKKQNLFGVYKKLISALKIGTTSKWKNGKRSFK